MDFRLRNSSGRATTIAAPYSSCSTWGVATKPHKCTFPAVRKIISPLNPPRYLWSFHAGLISAKLPVLPEPPLTGRLGFLILGAPFGGPEFDNSESFCQAAFLLHTLFGGRRSLITQVMPLPVVFLSARQLSSSCTCLMATLPLELAFSKPSASCHRCHLHCCGEPLDDSTGVVYHGLHQLLTPRSPSPDCKLN